MPIGKTSLFYEVTREELQNRWEMVQSGVKPSFTDLRHLFYEMRNKYLRRYLNMTKIDCSGYGGWEGNVIKRFCESKCYPIGLSRNRWFQVRDMMNIYAKGKAICDGETGSFLVDYQTRAKVSKSVSFILICEKDTVRRELLSALRGENYKLNVVSSGGIGTGDLKEAIYSVADLSNFYILNLHDYDLSGAHIHYDLKKHYPNVIDVGVNEEFLNYCQNIKRRLQLIEEPSGVNKKYWELRETIRQSGHERIYNIPYLVNKRIEIDAIHVELGIEPFIDFILKKIKDECPCWNLSYIGVKEFELEEPPNYYEQEIRIFEKEIFDKYQSKLSELMEPLENIKDIVENVLPDLEDFNKLYNKYWEGFRGEDETSVLKTDEMKNLREKFEADIQREWKNDYNSNLEELNKKITGYQGDLRTAEKDLKAKFRVLQERLNKSKKNDPMLIKFVGELEFVDWGEDKLSKLEPPDEKELIEAVIEALHKRLEEL
jgi:hypothetical protein